MTTRSSIGTGVSLLFVLALIATVAMVGLNGTDLPVTSGTNTIVSGAPEAISNAVPAFVEEQIVYGERATSDVTPGVEILPVYMVEAIAYGEMEPPTG